MIEGTRRDKHNFPQGIMFLRTRRTRGWPGTELHGIPHMQALGPPTPCRSGVRILGAMESGKHPKRYSNMKYGNVGNVEGLGREMMLLELRGQERSKR